MLIFTISGTPVPWAAHRGYGRKSFNPRYKEREFYQWQIKSQYNQEAPISGAVKLSYCFYMPIPKSISKARRTAMCNNTFPHLVRPDIDNLNKFLSDCLKTLVFEDDSQVVELNSRKIYSEIPKTFVQVEAL